MPKRVNLFWWVLAGIVLSRLIGMAIFPLVDTTEPRYAEIARIMAETGDWITPWFEPGVPFWGKPPLSFWLQALSIKVFGLSEFSARLPAWLATLALIWLTWQMSLALWGRVTARWSAMVFATMALTYISSGAVMTDSFLALGTTLSLVSFGMVMFGRPDYWRWLFFAGLVIGLLSKGPLAVVLTGLPIVFWVALNRSWATTLTRLPWIRGLLGTLVLAGPWYVLAELKTPGFLNYFLIGEHILRFIDPGWQGDLYGSAHLQPKGMIWLFWVWASFPWGLIFLAYLGRQLFGRGRRQSVKHEAFSRTNLFLLLSATTPMLFFTLASNTLWTYTLPSLPFSAMLIARWLGSEKEQKIRWVGAGLVPTLLTLFVITSVTDASSLKTEKQLVSFYNASLEAGDSPLYYVDDLPFSARYYSLNAAKEISMNEVATLLEGAEYSRYFLAVPKSAVPHGLDVLPTDALRSVQTENRRYQLLLIDSDTQPKPQQSSHANNA